jgi:simple sugar transport system substrate-binding protein
VVDQKSFEREDVMRKFILLAGAAMAVVLGASAAQAQDKTKACWMYVGPIGDFGYSYQHHQGLLAVQEKFGDKVETAYLESVPEGPDAERALERLARDGCDIIFATSFGFMDPVNKVAKRFPDVKFEHATGFKQESENVALYNARFYEAVTSSARSPPSSRRRGWPDISCRFQSRK